MCQGICVHFKLRQRTAVKGQCALLIATELDGCRSIVTSLRFVTEVIRRRTLTFLGNVPKKMVLTDMKLHLHGCNNRTVLHVTLRFYFGSPDSILGPEFESRLWVTNFSRLRIVQTDFWGPPSLVFSGHWGSCQWT